MMILKLPDYERKFRINGDEMIPGISISNSEVGILAFSIEAYFYRLVCTNGLIAKTSVASKFRHISLRALENFDETIAQVINESRYSQHKFTISMTSKVEQPLETINTLNRQFQLSKKQAEAVERAWYAEPGDTMFHVVNAYTRAAQDRELNQEESYKLEKVGGEILTSIRY